MSEITAANIDEFLKERNDFAFEMKVFKLLNEVFKLQNGHAPNAARVEIRHGETYIDPHLKKPRQFDFRVVFSILAGEYGQHSRIKLAIECKNLVPSNPLIISRTRRRPSEAKQDLISECAIPSSRQYIRGFKACKAGTFYPAGEFVGRDTQQLSIKSNYRENKSSIAEKYKSGDEEVHDRWNQAIASSRDLIVERSEDVVNKEPPETSYSAVLPVLVIPDRTLWVVDYGEMGERIDPPQLARSCEFLVNAPHPDETLGKDFVQSHMHILTLTGLDSFLRQLGKPHYWHERFPAAKQS